MSSPSSGAEPIENERALEQLKRITTGKTFSERQKRVLRFLVTEALDDRTVTDAVVASEFYNGNDDSMRADAGRIRERLELYYLTQGKLDPILIEIPKGGYVAEFSRRPSHVEQDF